MVPVCSLSIKFVKHTGNSRDGRYYRAPRNFIIILLYKMNGLLQLESIIMCLCSTFGS